jgi:hypothetical protein
MKSHRLEVADVIRAHGSSYLETYGSSTSADQKRVLCHLAACRTAALGGHKKKCDRCGHEEIAYNSCRNRHCPKCQGAARMEWLEARAQELLPVEYFHTIFTLPSTIGPLALQNKRVIYGILFQAAAETLLQIAADPKHLGARIGFLAVLHTWGQNLLGHPHLHCVVPGGGLSLDGSRWIACPSGFLLPVKVLSRVFRGKFLQRLGKAFDRGELSFYGALQALAEPSAFERWIADVRESEWVVYVEPAQGDPDHVLKYLARYTHRTAISNQRLISLDDGKVTFRWKDYRHGSRWRTMTLHAVEFIRRFLLHVLPTGFVRTRHYGLLANRVRQEKLALCRTLLGQPDDEDADQSETPADGTPDRPGDEPADTCPACRKGRMLIVEDIEPVPSRCAGRTWFQPFDTS